MSSISFPENSYALILGASSGFGRAAALAYASHGMHVIGVHLDRAAALTACEQLQEEIRSHGVEAHFFNINAADAGKRTEVIDAVESLLAGREGGSVHVLLHSLAFGALKPFIADEPRNALTQAQLEMTMNVMANSLVYWTQDLVHRGLMRNGGRIFAMTSSGSSRAIPTYGAVSAAKAALESYCRQLAFELGGRGITVNALQAGVTDTPALRKIPGNDALIADACRRNPFGRATTPEDVAEFLLLMSSKGAGWVNGAVLQVDGGESSVEVNWQSPEASA